MDKHHGAFDKKRLKEAVYDNIFNRNADLINSKITREFSPA
jgi:hypothetical protein